MPYSQLLKGRYSQPGQIYLVTTRVVRHAPLLELTTGRLVVNELRRLHQAGIAHSLAFVVMPDHLHWLMQLGDGNDLAIVVRQLKGRSARAVNRPLGRSGALWQRGFHDHALRREEDLATVARYVVRNPVRAGLVRRVGDWPLWDAQWVD